MNFLTDLNIRTRSHTEFRQMVIRSQKKGYTVLLVMVDEVTVDKAGVELLPNLINFSINNFSEW